MAAVQETEITSLKEQELKEAQRAIARKDAKIDQLRRDLESMRQQLEAKDKELRQVKTKPTSTKREKRGTAEVVIR
jgi:chromosome segregation ATPase